VLQDLEERERNLTAAQGRAEMAMQTLQRENRYQEEKVKEMDKKVLRAIFVFVAIEIYVAHLCENIYISNICGLHSIWIFEV
jgi:hypothetical protein